MDTLLRVPALPQHDQKVLGELIGKQPGGMGGNIACAASRLGLRTGMVSWIGDDADGRLVLADLQRFEVDTSHITVVPNTSTNYTTILLDPSGEKSIIIVPTAFDTLVFEPTLTAYLQHARLVYGAAYDPEQLANVAQVVHAAGGLVCTDLEPVAGFQDDHLRYILSLVDLAFIDADLLAAADYAQAARELQAIGPEIIIITLGARGSLAGNAQGVTRGQAFQVPVVDTTGAGDCFTAAFLTAYLHRQPLDQALRYASAAAALSIQAYGARGALPTAQQVQTFLNNYQELPI